MSIPKEPRQLMINVMYLVLTALLALNVSAEIFNAFDMVNKSLVKANNSLDEKNAGIIPQIKDAAKTKASFQTYADRIEPIKGVTDEATNYVTTIMNQLIDEGGNKNGSVDEADYVDNGGIKELKGIRNYDATTRFMVDEGKGEELKAKMLEYKNKFVEFADPADREAFAKTIPINIDDETWTKSVNKKENWADFTFGHMPLGATIPIFTKFINDIKSSEASALNYLSGKVGVGGTTIVLDKYTVVSSPEKSYVIKGEPFKTEVFLSASAGTDSKTGISISVNGKSLPTNVDGVAQYTETSSSVGIKKYTANASIKDPVTGEVKSYKREYEYEVGERSMTISAAKMNVFYIGVDNPVEVSVAGVPSAQVKVSLDGGDMSRNGDGTFTARVSRPGTAKVNVSAPGINGSKEFKVKRIPDPQPKLGSKEMGGRIGNGTFKGYSALVPVLDNFDFDARCDLSGFVLVRVAKRQDPEFAPNRGAKISGNAESLQSKATPGDKYIFKRSSVNALEIQQKDLLVS